MWILRTEKGLETSSKDILKMETDSLDLVCAVEMI
jgi:hypothetical protein